MRVLLWLLCIVTQLWTVKANVEKTIFLAPEPLNIPHVHPNLADLLLDNLLPDNHSIIETKLRVQFPTEAVPRGSESWYLLRGLEQGQRYEVRICWAATVSIHSTQVGARYVQPVASLQHMVFV